MDDEVYEKYRLAGKIASEAREYGKNLIKKDVSLLEVASKVEKKIIDNGAGLSFPVNISINEIAAHFSPRHDDEFRFKKGDVVKLDVGTHIDGYIADTALTVEVETNNYSEMIEASSKGLETAIIHMKAGVHMNEIGKAVQDTILSYGFKPIDNLTGHSLNRNILHAGMTVPSVPDLLNKDKPKEGDVLAIEPFATDGAGHVISGTGSNIYLCKESFNFRLIRDKRAKMVFLKFRSQFKTLPFAERWAENLFNNNDMTLRKLSFLGLIKHYPQLIESKKGIVTQKEHTVIVNEDGCEVTT